MQDCPLTVTGLFEHGEVLHSRVLLRVFDGHLVHRICCAKAWEPYRSVDATGPLSSWRVSSRTLETE